MAITDSPPKTSTSPIRQAMDRAGDGISKARQGMDHYLRNAATKSDEALLLDQPMRRERIIRRDAKIAVLGYVDAIFIDRTRRDGTVLEVSRERLVEELTDLIMRLEEACEVASEPVKE